MSETEVQKDQALPESVEAKFAMLQELVEATYENIIKAAEGNKQAARRARIALNDIKKICTPLRVQIQESVKKK